MKLKNIKIPEKEFFTNIFGSDIYLVGGTVRDHVLYGDSRNNNDYDFVVTGLTYKEIEERLTGSGKTNTVGKSFAVVKFSRKGITFDISIPRKDVRRDATVTCHKNFDIESGPHITLEEDLERRDFTCNSIAMRLIDCEVVDPFNGCGSLKDKVIRMTSPNSFSDDPLRILRAARFASVHNFTIEEEIYLKAKETDLSKLSSERVTEELFRILMESPEPSRGLSHYFHLSILEKLFPELYPATLTIQDVIFHPETDEQGHHTVWGHTIRAADISALSAENFRLSHEEKLTLLLATLLHDIGKPETTKWEFKRGRMTVTSIYHDSRGVTLAEALLERLKIDTRNNYPVKDTVLNLIKYHHRVFELYRNRDLINFKTMSRFVRDLKNREKLLILLDFADRQSREEDYLGFTEPDEITRWVFNKLDELNINAETIEPLLQGRDLIAIGIKPGPEMGKVLERMYNYQLDGEFASREEGLKFCRKKLKI